MRWSLFLFKSSQRSTGQVEVQTKCQNTHMHYSSQPLFPSGLLSPLIGALCAVSTGRPQEMGLEIELRCHPSRWSLDPGWEKPVEQGGKKISGWGSVSSLPRLLGTCEKWKELGTKEGKRERQGRRGRAWSSVMPSPTPAGPAALKPFLLMPQGTFSSEDLCFSRILFCIASPDCCQTSTLVTYGTFIKCLAYFRLDIIEDGHKNSMSFTAKRTVFPCIFHAL